MVKMVVLKIFQAIASDRLKNYVAGFVVDKVKLKKGEIAMHIATLKLLVESQSHPEFNTVAKDLTEAQKGITADMKKVTSAIDMACAETDSEILVEENGDVKVVESTAEE